MIDQAWQPRLAEGMVRAYLVEDQVTGFGLQAVNALHPEAPVPGPRLYHGPDLPGFQALKQQLESHWITLLRERVGLAPDRLPLLWDCDFMLGDTMANGTQRFVLCEINVSSVAPFPPSSIAPLVEAVRRRMRQDQADANSSQAQTSAMAICTAKAAKRIVTAVGLSDDR